MNETKNIDKLLHERDHERIYRFHRRLKRELEELLRIQRQISVRIEQANDELMRSNQQEATQLQRSAMAIDHVQKGQIVRLRRALQQMEEGEYGYCITCGGDVGEARLEFDPTIGICSACASVRSF